MIFIALIFISFLPSILGNPLSPTTSVTLCPCTGNETAPNSHLTPGHPNWHSQPAYNFAIHGMPCMCNFALHSPPKRDDYTYTPGIGSHKLHNRATKWNDARKICNEEGGHLAIINSAMEAHALMDIFNKSSRVIGASYDYVAYLGIHDLYQEGEWVSILGESLFKTGYTNWSNKWGGQPDNGGGNQNCGVLLKEGGLDDVSCNVPFAFFCELPIVQHL